MKKSFFSFVAAVALLCGVNTASAQTLAEYEFAPPKVSEELRPVVDGFLATLSENPADETVMKAMEKNKKIKGNKEQQVAIGYEFLDKNLFSQAIGISKRIQETDGQFTPALYLEADAWFKMANPKSYGMAAAKYEEIKSIDPDNIVPYLKMVRVYRYINPDYAIEIMQDIEKRREGDAKINQQLGTLYYQLNDTANAAKYYEKFFTAFPDGMNDYEIQKEYVILLYLTKNYEKARTAASQFMAKAPAGDPVLPRVLFRSNFDLKDKEGSKAAYDQFFGKFKDDQLQPGDINYKAQYLVQNKQYAEAIKAFQLTAEMDTARAAECERNIYTAYNKLEDYPSAIASCKKYLKLANKEKDVRELSSLGRLYVNAARAEKDSVAKVAYIDGGDKVFAEVSELDKDWYNGPFQRGQINHLRDSKNPSATVVTLFNETIKRLENKGEDYDEIRGTCYSYMAWAAAVNKDYGGAKKYANKALEYDPEDENAQMIADQLKDFKEE